MVYLKGMLQQACPYTSSHPLNTTWSSCKKGGSHRALGLHLILRQAFTQMGLAPNTEDTRKQLTHDLCNCDRLQMMPSETLLSSSSRRSPSAGDTARALCSISEHITMSRFGGKGEGETPAGWSDFHCQVSTSKLHKSLKRC
jgi:hypothetical protein